MTLRIFRIQSTFIKARLFKVSEYRVKAKRREVWELLNMESGEACFGLVCVRGSPHNRRWDSFSPVDRSGKWVGWVGPDLEIYF